MVGWGNSDCCSLGVGLGGSSVVQCIQPWVWEGHFEGTGSEGPVHFRTPVMIRQKTLVFCADPLLYRKFSWKICFLERDKNLWVTNLIVFHPDPIPGGCNLEFDLDIDPNIYLDYNPFETTIKFAPANLGYARYGGRRPSAETPPRVLLTAEQVRPTVSNHHFLE